MLRPGTKQSGVFGKIPDQDWDRWVWSGPDRVPIGLGPNFPNTNMYQPRTSKEPMDFHGEGEQMMIPTLKKATKIPMRTMRPIKNPISTRTSKNGLQNLHPSYDTLVKTFLTWKLSITVPGAQHKFSHHESPMTFFIKFSNFL